MQNEKIKKWIFYVACFIIIITGWPYSIVKNNIKNSRMEVGGKTTTLIDLCYKEHRDEILENNKDIENILTSTIEGLEKYRIGRFSENSLTVLFFRNLYDTSDSPYKICSELKPVLYDIKIFELDSEYYVKIFYITDDKLSGFSAVYKFIDNGANRNEV